MSGGCVVPLEARLEKVYRMSTFLSRLETGREYRGMIPAVNGLTAIIT